MKKLSKVHNRKNTVEAFKSCRCRCTCYCKSKKTVSTVSYNGSVAGGAITSVN